MAVLVEPTQVITYATVIRCVHNRARVFHLHSKALFYAIGEPNSVYHRPVAPRVAIERLMMLDGVLAGHDFKWLTTRREKAALVLALGGSEAAENASIPSLEKPGEGILA